MKGTCYLCSKKGQVHKGRKSGKLICFNCYRMLHHYDPSTHEQCSLCGEIKQVITRDINGKAICPRCYRKNPSTHEQCSLCGEIKQVITRDINGKAICPRCYRKSKLGICIHCGEVKIIEANKQCSKCYRKNRRMNKKLGGIKNEPNKIPA